VRGEALPPPSRLKRAFVYLILAAVIYVPGIVTAAMLLTGNA